MKNSNNNRGFAFIEYHNHKCAEYSRQKMTNPKFKLGSNAPTVSWADPRNADSSGASQVLFNLFISLGDWHFHQITAVMLCYMNRYISFNFCKLVFYVGEASRLLPFSFKDFRDISCCIFFWHSLLYEVWRLSNLLEVVLYRLRQFMWRIYQGLLPKTS